MNPALIVLIVIAVVLVVAFIVLTILGKKAQKRKEEQDEQIAAASQTVNMLIIDKKRMKLKDAIFTIISLNLDATIATFIPSFATTFPSNKLISLMIFSSFLILI